MLENTHLEGVLHESAVDETEDFDLDAGDAVVAGAGVLQLADDAVHGGAGPEAVGDGLSARRRQQ